MSHGDNVRLLDGKALIALDRSASFSRREAVGEMLTGLLIEIRANRELIESSTNLLMSHIQTQENLVPIHKFRCNATANYLIRPFMSPSINLERVRWYVYCIETYENFQNYLSLKVAVNLDTKKIMYDHQLKCVEKIGSFGEVIERQVMAVLQELGPLTGL